MTARATTEMSNDEIRWALAWAKTEDGSQPLLPWLTVPCPRDGGFVWLDGKQILHQEAGSSCPSCDGRGRIPLPVEQYSAFVRFGLTQLGFAWRMEADDPTSVRTSFWKNDGSGVRGEADEPDGFTSTLRAGARGAEAAGLVLNPRS